ncbi:MAG: hypothetical protein J6Y48_02855 [Clostridia bacterium]|nr:hypothetical protein [Clostridia bacterium]
MAGITGRNPYAAYQNPYLPSMNGYQVPGYGWPGMQTGPQQQMMQQPGQTPQMTKPTVHADIIQIENEAAGENEPVDAGTSQMMITKDESVILVKSVLANGETTMDIYRKQPKAEKPAEPEYVTREEFDRWVAEMSKPEPAPVRHTLRVLEPAEDEPEDETPAPRPVQRTRNTNGGKRG